jgi:hypothetical protein
MLAGTNLEANEIGSKHAVQDLESLWQRPEDLRTREGSVDEEADGRVREELSDHLWGKKEMVYRPDQQRKGGELVCIRVRLVLGEGEGTERETHNRG